MTPPDALLFIGPGCPHCASLLQHLQGLIKESALGELRIINLAAKPGPAAKLNIRAVPWLKLGEFELEGARSLGELKQWIERANSPTGMADYFAELLALGQRQKVQDRILSNGTLIKDLLALASDMQRGMDIRIGIGAIMEDLAEQDALTEHLETIIDMTRHEEATIRADGAHYLSLVGGDKAIKRLQALSGDESAIVREVTQDALEEISQNH